MIFLADLFTASRTLEIVKRPAEKKLTFFFAEDKSADFLVVAA